MRKSRMVDDDGNSVTTWSAVGDPICAEVVGINGREAVIGRALEGVSYFRLLMRFRRDIEEADQLVHDGRALNIRSIADPDGRRQSLEILADTGSTEVTA